MAETTDSLRLAATVVGAYVAHNSIPSKELGTLVTVVYEAFRSLAAGEATRDPRPAVTVKSSVAPEYLICLEDGMKLKILKRYLRTRHGLAPDAYRTKWKLPADYPMIAPNYAARRSALAKEIGLGQARRQKLKSRAASRKTVGGSH